MAKAGERERERAPSFTVGPAGTCRHGKYFNQLHTLSKLEVGRGGGDCGEKWGLLWGEVVLFQGEVDGCEER